MRTVSAEVEKNILEKWKPEIFNKDLLAIIKQYKESNDVRDESKDILGKIAVQFLNYYDTNHDMYENLKKDMNKKWDNEFLNERMSKYYVGIDMAQKKTFGRKKAINQIVADVQMHASFSLTADNIVDETKAVEDYQEKMVEEEHFNKQVLEFIHVLVGVDGDIDSVREIVRRRNESIVRIEDIVNEEFDIELKTRFVMDIDRMYHQANEKMENILNEFREIALNPISESNFIDELEEIINAIK